MDEATTIVLAVVDSWLAAISVSATMIRSLGAQVTTLGAQVSSLSTQVNALTTRVDGLAATTARGFETASGQVHQGFENVQHGLGDNRERKGRIHGPIEGFLAGRNKDAG